MKRLLALCGFVVGLSALAACGGGSDGGEATPSSPPSTSEPAAPSEGTTEPLTLRIGFSGALSGAYAFADVPMLNGMKMAAEQINAAGGPITVEIVEKDNKGDQTLAATTAQELLDDGIAIQVMTVADPGPAVGALVTQAGGIISLGANTAPTIVGDVGDRAFSFVFGDNGQAAAAAEYACAQGYTTAYLIGSPEFPYTRDLPVYFKDAFAHDCDGQIVGEDTYKIGQAEYGTQVTKIQAVSTPPDVIYSPIFTPDAGVFLKQLRSSGVDVPFVTSDGNDSQLFVDSGGSSVDGTVYTTHGFASPGSAMEQFVEDFTTITGNKPESTAIEAIGRDNVYALVQAVTDAGSVEPDDVLAAVLALKDVPLVTGTMTMNPETRFPLKDVTLVKMEGTEFTFLETISPEYIPEAVG
jgi:branched-chain amino acid transport system substrate-binding protein